MRGNWIGDGGGIGGEATDAVMVATANNKAARKGGSRIVAVVAVIVAMRGGVAAVGEVESALLTRRSGGPAG